ncbi:MAG: membrane protein [Bacteroidetes bacterium]|nr:MAG: membrane protein [Bacteroidota bacterium]
MKKKSRIKTIVILITNFIAICICKAEISDTSEYVVSNVEILTTTGINHSFETVSRQMSTEFKPYVKPEYDIEKNVTFWLRFDYLQNDLNNIKILFSHHLWFKKIELYYYNKGKLVIQKTGDMIPLNNRAITDPASLMLVLPRNTEKLKLYLYLESNYDYLFLFIINNLNDKLKSNFKENSLETFFYGILALAIVFSLTFLIFLKERIYFFYIIYCILLVLSRTVNNGFLYHFLPIDFLFNDFKNILSIYSFTSMGITTILLLYIRDFLNIKKYHYKISKTITILAIIRVLFWVIYFVTNSDDIKIIFGSFYIDIIYILLMITFAIYLYSDHPKISIIAISGLFTVFLGMLVGLLKIDIFNLNNPHTTYLNLTTLEVIIFSTGVAYRHYYYKKESEKSNMLLVKQLRENEELKDNINKELEAKVKERTLEILVKNEEIAKMNDLLKLHNIELSHEVQDISKARLFQKNMRFDEFKKTFSSNETCIAYLSNLKWNDKNKYKCAKCAYENYKTLDNLSVKCKKCNHIESPMANTLFHNIKFPIQKAFYITYSTSTGTNDLTIESAAKELELRMATYFTFRQKVLSLIEKNKSRKKHKDGWTHLIEYSIEKQ